MTGITQDQAIDIVKPLLEYVGVDPQDVSKIEFTASRYSITAVTPYGSTVTWDVPYEGGN